MRQVATDNEALENERRHSEHAAEVHLGGEEKVSDNDEEMSENEDLDVNRHARNTTTTAGSKKKHITAKGRDTTCTSTCKRINCLVGKYG